ncbi:MAG TPA: bifunctional DNA primase/polymerase, partial [Planctomycetaceae bacterium]
MLPDESDPLLVGALAYARVGLRVVPCHAPCETGCTCRRKGRCGSAGKHPRLRSDWPAKAMADVRQIRLWWKRWPAANVGIATGRESGLVVLDFDLRSGGLASHDRLLRDFPGLDETVTVRTGGGGLHLWFAHPGVHVGNRVGGTNARFRGVDVRGDGGLVIAPPSRHRAGVYEFAPGRGLGEVPLAHLPAGLLEAFGFFATNELSRSDSGEAQNHTSKETRPPKQGHVLGTLSAKQNEEIGAAVRQSVPTGPGMRNQQVFVLVRRLKFLSCLEGIDPEELRPVVKEWFDRARATARERGFAIEGGFAETMDDFLYGWPRAK